ncbi:MAG TPA: hypothetical protein VM939_03590 [Gemmatimonadaceae bacterium]|nr:hypothetical protein [Gemmatimonadaceae bacterium]
MRKILALASLAAILFSACGGPESIEPPPPAQTVNAYWVGVEGVGDTHVHITLTQNGTTLGLQQNCFIERCSFLPFSAAGATAIGSSFPVAITAASGTFNNPNISFTFTLANNRTFSFTGKVAQDKFMQGDISGTTLPKSTITLEKQP